VKILRRLFESVSFPLQNRAALKHRSFEGFSAHSPASWIVCCRAALERRTSRAFSVYYKNSELSVAGSCCAETVAGQSEGFPGPVGSIGRGC
jgi:hypothetical protein